MAEWAFYVRPKAEVAVDSGDGFTFNLHGVAAQADPAPLVYDAGVLQTVTTDYTFDYGDATTAASITFLIAPAGAITCTYRWKYACSEDEDASVYDVGKEINTFVEKDVNGRTIVAISYSPAANFRGQVVWEYMPSAFYDEWQIIIDNAYTFDIERTSDGTEPRTLANLQPLTELRFTEIPGVPDRLHVGIEFVQL